MKYDLSSLLPFHKEAKKSPEDSQRQLMTKLKARHPDLKKSIVTDPTHKENVRNVIYAKADPDERRDMERAINTKAYDVAADTTYYPDKTIKKIKHSFFGVGRSGKMMGTGEGRSYFSKLTVNADTKISGRTQEEARKDHNKIIQSQPGLDRTVEKSPTVNIPKGDNLVSKFKK
jgi:hypothetical protein